MALFKWNPIQAQPHPMRTARSTILFEVRLPYCCLSRVMGRRKRMLFFQSNTSGESMVYPSPMKSSSFPVKSWALLRCGVLVPEPIILTPHTHRAPCV